ncbi:MAG: trehalase family glycosidase [Lentisphaeria bacterium]|nr:trehalase family glycosidase [Lentisphaeria bacterium]
MNVEFDIASIPFSRFGSYTAFSYLQGETHAKTGLPEGIWLRCVHGDAAYEVMRIEMVDNGVPVSCRIVGGSAELSLLSKTGRVDICLPTENTIRFRVTNATLRFTARPFRNHCAIPESGGNWILTLARSFRSYRLVPLSGTFTMDAPWEIKHCKHIIAELSATIGQTAELAIEELTWMRPPQDHTVPFDTLTEDIQAQFEAFCKPFLSCPKSLRETAISAAYLDWSSVVHPHRLLTRPAMYMSKNWMTNVWAWDHAFNALAVCLSDPDLAWDQLMVIFDHQDETGQIPDFINDVRFLTCFVKPPVHGWILKRMIDYAGALPPERLREAYHKLSLWTDWWFTYRDPEEDGLPVYWHGNDSGWDNGTVFDVPFPIKSADLSAFLVVQMDTLALIADTLERNKDAANWRQRADRTLKALIDTLWDGKKFRSVSTVTGQAALPSDSVFGCLPIILGKRLPDAIRTALITEIRRHVTEWGPATEHPDSPLYETHGYWRGPIWAPPTMILVDGLHAAGETELAHDIAERFCHLCARSGFAENFDAITGAPLCDPAYTWTSSVFLILANKFVSNVRKMGGERIATTLKE